MAWNSFASPTTIASNTYGYRWNYQLIKTNDSSEGTLVTLPEFFHLVTNENHTAEWVPVRPEDVPAETGLVQYQFKRPLDEAPEPYVTPDKATSCWRRPGLVAGPFQAYPGGRQRGDVLLVSFR